MSDKIYTVETAAEYLTIGTRKLTDTIRAGELTAYKKFNRWYILHSDIVEFIKS